MRSGFMGINTTFLINLIERKPVGVILGLEYIESYISRFFSRVKCVFQRCLYEIVPGIGFYIYGNYVNNQINSPPKDYSPHLP